MLQTPGLQDLFLCKYGDYRKNGYKNQSIVTPG